MGRGLVVASLLWDANETSFPTSRCYTDDYAEKLANGFERHLKINHKFVLFTDKKRDLPKSIEQIVEPDLGLAGYSDCIRPFKLNAPMILVGMDTLVVGNCDKFARYCLEADCMAMPKDPYKDVTINGVVLCPGGMKSTIFDPHQGENDMVWLRQFPHNRIDDLWPGKVLSYKADVRKQGLPPKARIVYFHGSPKMSQAVDNPTIAAHWW